MEADIERGR